MPRSVDSNESEQSSVMSFFAGCGGLDLGFLGGFRWRGKQYPQLPFEVIAAFDNDSRAIETYNANIPGGHGCVTDLASVDVNGIDAADVLIGGFPCQDFSSCGPKRGLGSDRGQLFRVLTRYMETHQPKLVIAENVPHLARMGGGIVIDTILKSFEGAGYQFNVWNLFAPDFGVPQRRNRLFFVGVRDDIYAKYGSPEAPEPTHAGRHRSIDWAIADLSSVTDDSIPNQDQYFKASKAKRGNGQGDETNRRGEPSYTIRANAKSRVQFHYELPRRLTVRECARLQTFPDTFEFRHSATTNIMQIGNAVPPILGHVVARQVARFLSNVNFDSRLGAA